MTLEKAFARIAELYYRYQQIEEIENPLSLALFQTSREAIDEEKPKERVICNECEYLIDVELSEAEKQNALLKDFNIKTKKECVILGSEFYGLKSCKNGKKRYRSAEQIMTIVNGEERRQAIMDNPHLFEKQNS